MSKRDIHVVIMRLHRARRELKRLEGRGEVSMRLQDLKWFISDAEEIIEETMAYAR